nr:T9SS type A sorting domain-containing protein [Saprospiraceae bacterium]
PKGFGVKLIPGARLVVQVHYPEGNVGKIDDTKIHFKFSRTNEDIREILVLPLLNHRFSMVDGPLFIPAGTSRTFQQRFYMPFKVTITSIAPHAHLVCESMKAFGVTPSGDTLNFIDIPHWDFEWQGYYQFKEPVVVPAGTRLHGIARYNNTSVNHHLPYDQPRDVNVGEATSDEMMVFFFGVAGYKQGDEQLLIDRPSASENIEDCQNQQLTPQEEYQERIMSIVPNPTAASFFVQIPEGYQRGIIEVWDTGGKLHLRQFVTAHLPMEITTTFPAGSYVVRLRSNDHQRGPLTSKLIVMQ